MKWRGFVAHQKEGMASILVARRRDQRDQTQILELVKSFKFQFWTSEFTKSSILIIKN